MDFKVEASLGLELSIPPKKTLVKEATMKSKTNSNIVKNVRAGIVALLGYLAVDFSFERGAGLECIWYLT